MDKFSANSKRIVIICSSIIIMLFTMTVFTQIITKKAEKNFNKGSLNAAITGYETVRIIHKTEENEKMLATARYEKDAVAKINKFYDEMQRVKKEVEYASDNNQIMEVTKSVASTFYEFDRLETNYDGDIASYIKIVKGEPDYKLYKEEYLTGQAVITKKTDKLLDGLLSNITKDSVKTIVDNILQMERPEECFIQKHLPDSIEDRTNMRILNSKYKFLLGILLILLMLILGITIYALRLISLKDKVYKEKLVKKELINKIYMISSGFRNGIIPYEDAIEKLEIIGRKKKVEEEVNASKKNIQQLHISNIAYKKGLEFKRFKKYDQALHEFKKVIKEDRNYEDAIEEIKAILPEEPKEAEEIIKEEQDLLKKKLPRDDVQITGIREYSDSINTNFIAVRIKNNTKNKRIKSYKIGFVGFNNEGRQEEVGLVSGNYIGRGRVDNQEIGPNEEADSGGGWYVANQEVIKLIACVEEVEYHDQAEKWINPNYKSWENRYEHGMEIIKRA